MGILYLLCSVDESTSSQPWFKRRRNGAQSKKCQTTWSCLIHHGYLRKWSEWKLALSAFKEIQKANFPGLKAYSIRKTNSSTYPNIFVFSQTNRIFSTTYIEVLCSSIYLYMKVNVGKICLNYVRSINSSNDIVRMEVGIVLNIIGWMNLIF